MVEGPRRDSTSFDFFTDKFCLISNFLAFSQINHEAHNLEVLLMGIYKLC